MHLGKKKRAVLHLALFSGKQHYFSSISTNPEPHWWPLHRRLNSTVPGYLCVYRIHPRMKQGKVLQQFQLYLKNSEKRRKQEPQQIASWHFGRGGKKPDKRTVHDYRVRLQVRPEAPPLVAEKVYVNSIVGTGHSTCYDHDDHMVVTSGKTPNK